MSLNDWTQWGIVALEFSGAVFLVAVAVVLLFYTFENAKDL